MCQAKPWPGEQAAPSAGFGLGVSVGSLTPKPWLVLLLASQFPLSDIWVAVTFQVIVWRDHHCTGMKHP